LETIVPPNPIPKGICIQFLKSTLSIAPHSSTHAPHKHSEDEFFFVLEGTAQFYLNGETLRAEALTSFYCPSNSEQGIKNVVDTELKYLVIKKYILN
jgi:quercetin dioxygenase-like cupin family protein